MALREQEVDLIMLFFLFFIDTNFRLCCWRYFIFLKCTVYITPVMVSSPSLWELLHVRPSATTTKMYISPHGSSLMSQAVSEVVQQNCWPPLIASSVAAYVTAPGTADQEMSTVRLSHTTDFFTFSGGQGAGE